MTDNDKEILDSAKNRAMACASLLQRMCNEEDFNEYSRVERWLEDSLRMLRRLKDNYVTTL